MDQAQRPFVMPGDGLGEFLLDLADLAQADHLMDWGSFYSDLRSTAATAQGHALKLCTPSLEASRDSCAAHPACTCQGPGC